VSRWYLTDDQRIAITGGNQCLDEGDNGIQTYQCTTGNTNQGRWDETSHSCNTYTILVHLLALLVQHALWPPVPSPIAPYASVDVTDPDPYP
jgi:hypothetical protein